MQAAFRRIFYDGWDMAKAASRLKTLREAAGISQRELAQQIGEHHSSVGFGERTDSLPKSKVLVQMAWILGVMVAEFVGDSKTKRTLPVGVAWVRFGSAFPTLPRRQQQWIIEMAETFLSVHENGKTKATNQ